jgi:cell division protein FtsI (penicillin-binding protein 3)
LGFVSADGDGSEGLEAAQNDHLRGQEFLTQRRRDRRGGGVDDLLGEYDSRMSAGKTVVLTIDRQIQRITERALEQVMVTSQPAAASAIVVDVATGDLLALASLPTYNPNDPGDDPVPRWNHAVYDTIEPGSVFKPFTVAAAMEEGLVSEFSPIDCEGGGWSIGRARIRDDHPHGTITLSEVIKYSSNIGSAKLALEMGEHAFLSYMKKFGFGRQTGVPLPGEPKGKIRSAETIKKIELATTAFGQGVTTTPLQLAMATAALANDGALMRPRLVSKVIDAYGTFEQLIEPEMVEQVVSPETAQAVRRMMVTVTEPGGTATRARVPGYVVGGKTGTAQKAENGAYGKGRIGSFVGFIPADKPVLAVVVSVDDPSVGSRYGGIVAAPAFAVIAEEAMRVLGVPPDPELLPKGSGTKGGDLDALAPSLMPVESGRSVRWTGSGWELPALTGLSTREALATLNGSGLKVQVVGEGVVVQQSPSPGAILAPGGSLRLSLAEPTDGGA